MTAPRQSTHKSSYLSKLKFDPKLSQTFIAKYVTNFRYVLLLILIIAAVGTSSFINLPRRLNPQINIPIVIVSTVLPGASPQDIESLVTIPIEDSLSDIPNIDTTTSVSQENVSIITMQFTSGVDPNKASDDVKSKVDTVTNLPKDAKTPNIQKLDFENQPVWQFLITSKGDDASLSAFSQNLQDKLKKSKIVKDVALSGQQQDEIQFLIKPEAQKTFGIDANSLARTIQTAVGSYPSGNLDTKNSSFSLSLDSTVKTLEDFRNLPIIINGQPVRISEIAEVSQKPIPNQPETFWTAPSLSTQRSVAFSIFKTESADISEAVSQSRKIIEEELKLYPGQFNQVSILDTSQLISKEFDNVLASFRDTIILVAITLFVFLGLRQALIVAFSIPLSFLVAFTVMNIMGLTLNFLTLFSLILALGLLVDDAIVVVTAITAYWRTRQFSPNETGLLVLRDFMIPIWSTTITAVWAFLPILLSGGIIGEFIKSIPIVVSTTLLASTAIAVLITLPLTIVFLRPNPPKRVKYLLIIISTLLVVSPVFLLTAKLPILPIALILSAAAVSVFFRTRRQLSKILLYPLHKKLKPLHDKFFEYSQHGVIDSQNFAAHYEKLITRVISSKSASRKTLAAVTIFAVFAYLLVPLGFVQNEFFPKTDQNELFLSVELPTGTNLQTSKKEALRLLEELRSTPQLKYVTVQLGQSLNLQSGGQSQSQPNNFLFTFNLTEKEKRSTTSFQIAEMLREKFKNYPQGKASVIEQSSGPPAGADIQIKLLGEELPTLDDNAQKVVSFLEKQPGVTNIQKSINSGTSKIVFVPDTAKMAVSQITQDQIGQQLRAFASGFPISQDFKLNSKSYDIVLRQTDAVQNPQDLPALSIKTQNGILVPLSQLGQFRLTQNPTQITREDSQRTLSVTASVTKGFSISKTNQKLEAYANNGLNLPEGYSWKTGGINEENQKSVNSILQAMILAFILIAATMIIQFGSYRKAFIILLLIPLAISGVFVIFALTKTPLSFPTLIGILALFGIVVYQAMMIVDKINRNLKTTHMNLKEAVADGAASRVEPILFGTITTVVGLIPITLSDPLWRGLGGAIISGMLFSGGIMLLFVPVVYYMIYKNSEGKSIPLNPKLRSQL